MTETAYERLYRMYGKWIRPEKTFGELMAYFKEHYENKEVTQKECAYFEQACRTHRSNMEHHYAENGMIYPDSQYVFYEVFHFDYMLTCAFIQWDRDRVFVIFDPATETCFSNSSVLDLELSLMKGITIPEPLDFSDIRFREYLTIFRFLLEDYPRLLISNGKERIKVLVGDESEEVPFFLEGLPDNPVLK